MKPRPSERLANLVAFHCRLEWRIFSPWHSRLALGTDASCAGVSSRRPSAIAYKCEEDGRCSKTSCHFLAARTAARRPAPGQPGSAWPRGSDMTGRPSVLSLSETTPPALQGYCTVGSDTGAVLYLQTKAVPSWPQSRYWRGPAGAAPVGTPISSLSDRHLSG